MPKRRNRNYKKEYERDHSDTKAKKDRAGRNKARRQAVRDGRVKKGDGKDVDHKDGNPRNNSKSNIKVVKRSTNRKRNYKSKSSSNHEA